MTESSSSPQMGNQTGQAGENDPSLGSRIGLWLRRIFRSDAQIESEELVEQAKKSGAIPISDITDRSRVTVQGTVSATTINPKPPKPWFIVYINDGSGSLTLVWFGRNTIAGIEPGRKLRVHGLAVVRHEKVMYNPEYELLS